MKTERFKIIWIEKFPGWKLGRQIKNDPKNRKIKFGLGPRGKTIFIKEENQNEAITGNYQNPG